MKRIIVMTVVIISIPFFVVLFWKEENIYFNEINLERIKFHKIEYDEKFINEEYLPKLRILIECLKTGKFPKEEQ